MSAILLDTNVAIKIMKNREQTLLNKLSGVIENGHTLFMSTVSLLELQVGVLRNSNTETAVYKRKSFFTLIEEFWSFEEADAWIAADIRHQLLKQGNVIGAYDIMIAAQAIRRDVLLITANADEFRRVAGLRWENWAPA